MFGAWKKLLVFCLDLMAVAAHLSMSDGSKFTKFMTTQKQEQKAKPGADDRNPFDMVFGRPSTARGLDWAIIGCLVAGAVGIIKALGMDSPSSVLLCLLGSVSAFGLVIYVQFQKP
jgi:hypothetical protein